MDNMDWETIVAIALIVTTLISFFGFVLWWFETHDHWGRRIE